tara:strand:- start:138 stop:551 length:414 start_codon:yes stop_codon:yes gene_type:complete
MNSKKKKLYEEVIRLMAKKAIRKYLKEGEGGNPDTEEDEELAAADASTQPDAETAEKPIEEPEEKPIEEPEEEEEEEGLSEDLAELTDYYIKKLKNTDGDLSQEDVSEIMATLLDSFGYGNQEKLTVLQNTKEQSIR